MGRRTAGVVLAAVVVAGCGRAGPGATLTRRKDPDVAAHDVTHRKCVELVKRKRVIRRDRRYQRDDDYRCVRWETTGTEHVEAVTHEAHEERRGPAPLVSVIPAVALGRSMKESGGSGAPAFWLDAGAQLHVIPPPDRFSAYVSAGYLGIGNQGDLSGFSAGAGAMVAITGSWSLDAHGGAVLRGSTPWRAGGGIRWRPKHHTSRDWTVSLSIEHVAGEDTQEEDFPFDMVANHATGVVLGLSGGWLP